MVTTPRREKAQARHAELERFRWDPACGVLLMDTSGVVGLDLSFASLVIGRGYEYHPRTSIQV